MTQNVEETEIEDYIDYGNGDYVRIENDRSSNGNDIAQYENDQNDINREPIISQNDRNKQNDRNDQSDSYDDEEYYDNEEYYDEDDSYYDDEEYYDESYEEPDDYKNEYFEDYKVTRKEIDETYGSDGARCSPEGKITHNPNDCASFLVCNHKKYMVSISKYMLEKRFCSGRLCLAGSVWQAPLWQAPLWQASLWQALLWQAPFWQAPLRLCSIWKSVKVKSKENFCRNDFCGTPPLRSRYAKKRLYYRTILFYRQDPVQLDFSGTPNTKLVIDPRKFTTIF